MDEGKINFNHSLMQWFCGLSKMTKNTGARVLLPAHQMRISLDGALADGVLRAPQVVLFCSQGPELMLEDM